VPGDLNLSNLKPAQKRRDRKRIGRGLGSGKGRYSGRGLKGQKSRSGSHAMRAGFEGGQMPIYMRLGKQRGPYSKDAMPVGPHRTSAQAVNVRDLERVFEPGTDVTPDTLKAKRLIRTTRVDVKILGEGELTKSLSVAAHMFSKTAREKIERAGGSVVWLRGEPEEKAVRRRRRKKHAEAPAGAGEDRSAAEAAAEPEGSGDGSAEPSADAEE
jgi:large subunit ribosomal protein L15